MKKSDTIEEDILTAYEKGELRSISPSKALLKKYSDSVRALEEGVPYQTLIASVLHKFVTGRLVEKPSRLITRSTGRAKKRAG